MGNFIVLPVAATLSASVLVNTLQNVTVKWAKITAKVNSCNPKKGVKGRFTINQAPNTMYEGLDPKFRVQARGRIVDAFSCQKDDAGEINWDCDYCRDRLDYTDGPFVYAVADYSSTNPSYPGNGTAFLCFSDTGKKKIPDVPEYAFITFPSGPFDALYFQGIGGKLKGKTQLKQCQK